MIIPLDYLVIPSFPFKSPHWGSYRTKRFYFLRLNGRKFCCLKILPLVSVCGFPVIPCSFGVSIEVSCLLTDW